MPMKSRYILSLSVLVVLLAALTYAVQVQLIPAAIDGELSELVLATRHPANDWVVVLVTLLGDGIALTLIGAAVTVALAFRSAWWPAVTTGLVFITTPFVVKAIKLLVGRERPNADLYSGVESFSFPSGHMTNSMVIYGTLAMLAAYALEGWWRRAALAGFVTLIVSIGASRVYLGAHWPSDVIAAMLLATIMLCVVHSSLARQAGDLSLRRAFVLVFLFTLAVWAVYGFLTLEVALDIYKIDVDPEGTIDIEPPEQ
ncbi:MULTISPECIES: phosphatase PAP2 family protein [Henriciella]|uniref:phosphatase PAP2 family protein n=1 Tax=Henriciella TaxID=453849 RepID=UPI0035152063